MAEWWLIEAFNGVLPPLRWKGSCGEPLIQAATHAG